MKKHLKAFLFFLTLLFFQNTQAQTIDFDNHNISIGDSLEQVISNFNNYNYVLNCDTMDNSITYRSYKLSPSSKTAPNNSNRTRKCIGYLYFSYQPDTGKEQTKKLYQVGKVWSNWKNSDPLSLIEAVFNVLAEQKEDNYYKDFSFSIQKSSSSSTKKFILKLSTNVSLEIYVGDSGYYMVTEYITKDLNKKEHEIYLTIFYDSENLINKTNNIITKKFLSEKEAESGINMWQIQHLSMGYNLPFSKIIKFWDKKIGEFKK